MQSPTDSDSVKTSVYVSSSDDDNSGLKPAVAHPLRSSRSRKSDIGKWRAEHSRDRQGDTVADRMPPSSDTTKTKPRSSSPTWLGSVFNTAEPNTTRIVRPQPVTIEDEQEEQLTPKLWPELCVDCKTLNISRASFIIDAASIKSNRKSQHVKKATTTDVATVQTRLKSGWGTQKLRNHDIILSRSSSCRMCELFARAIDTYGNVAEPGEALECFVQWEVDGHEEVPWTREKGALRSNVFRNRTRRLRLRWQATASKAVKEAFIVIVARDTISERDQPDDDRRNHHTFQARKIGIDDGRQTLIKGWLDGCHESHGPACRMKVTQKDEFIEKLQEPFFGFIDVTDLQLVQLPIDDNGDPAKYVAFSYVWGMAKQAAATTRSNVNGRRRKGGLERALRTFPRAIQDAISLVQRLNLRYLWIDALCIVQDSSTSFKLNADIMHTIYGNAHFTICAADGSDSQAGLVALQAQAQGNRTEQVIVQVVPGLHLQAVRPPEVVIQDSVWNTRGWTFQERILSRKCVVFAEGKVYYQCRRAALCEEIHNDISSSEWSLQSIGSPMHYLPEIESRAASFYMKSVTMFYRRNLTRSGDILSAYRGVEAVLEKVLCAPFCFGIPTSHFDLGLLWQPLRANIRRVPRPHVHTARCGMNAEGEYTCNPMDDVTQGKEFPSWSWCGWQGGDVGYDSDMLAGCTSNVSVWLCFRTWIRWHISTGKGRLRPLWNRWEAESDMSLHSQWQGYKARPHRKADYEPVAPSTVGVTPSTLR